jgi:hypothetical protein
MNKLEAKSCSNSRALRFGGTGMLESWNIGTIGFWDNGMVGIENLINLFPFS